MPGDAAHLLLAQLVQKAAAATLPGGGDMSGSIRRCAWQQSWRGCWIRWKPNGSDFADIRNLAPEELAEHWQLTLRFLDILQQNWPEILGDEGAVDAAERRNLLLERQGRAVARTAAATSGHRRRLDRLDPRQRRSHRDHRGIAAGPRHPAGLDDAADKKIWDEIAVDPAHPQFGFAQLLARLQAAPGGQVWLWPHVLPDGPQRAAPPTRNRIVGAALLPADATSDWPAMAATMRKPEGVANLLGAMCSVSIAAPSRRRPGIIALMLREAGGTAGTLSRCAGDT